MRIETVCVYMYYLLLFGLLDVVDTFESSLLEHRSTPPRGDDKNNFWGNTRRRRPTIITMTMLLLFLAGRLFGEAAAAS